MIGTLGLRQMPCLNWLRRKIKTTSTDPKKNSTVGGEGHVVERAEYVQESDCDGVNEICMKMPKRYN